MQTPQINFQSFTEYAKKILSENDITYAIDYSPRQGDGKVLRQHLLLEYPNIPSALEDKGYYTNPESQNKGLYELYTPPIVGKRYGEIPPEIDYLEPASNNINVWIKLELLKIIYPGTEKYFVFPSSSFDVKEGDDITFFAVGMNDIVLTRVTSLNALVNPHKDQYPYRLIASLEVITDRPNQAVIEPTGRVIKKEIDIVDYHELCEEKRRYDLLAASKAINVGDQIHYRSKCATYQLEALITNNPTLINDQQVCSVQILNKE